MVLPKSKGHLPKRLVRKLYKKAEWSPKDELKATGLTQKLRLWFADKIVGLVNREDDIKLIAITVKKKNVQEHLRRDPNKLYNYMTRLALVDHIASYPTVEFVPDARTIKVASGNSLIDYLQIHLWFEMNVQTVITCNPQQSDKNINLQFTDYLTNFIWRKYEFNDSGPFNKLRDVVERKQLFF